ncbi:MAG: rhodanese-like domain-containing protein [Flavobacteriales bacterium]|nr:rhodanese-like domain-containing protein [Flavobacteriales bacterium]
MNIGRTTLLSILAIGLFAACGQSGTGGAIAPAAFKKAITADAQLIDVRTPAEFIGGHLPNARNLDWTSGQLESSMASLDKNAPVLLYCASGKRSAAAREALIKAGFTDVHDLDGGIRAWSASGGEIVND